MEFKSLCVLGLGYIGLPTASTFATHGLRVIGVDTNILQHGVEQLWSAYRDFGLLIVCDL